MEARSSNRIFGAMAAIMLCCLASPGSAQDLKNLCAPAEATDPQPLHINGAKPFIYKTVGNVDLRVHVFSLPERPAGLKSPAVVFYYGGGFVFGDIRRYQTQATHLALHGLVTVLVDYRVKCREPATTIMDEIGDAKSAMRWVRGHADQLGIDPARIAAAGSSAGGLLAAATALVPGFDDPADDTKIDPRPNALVLYNPGLDTGSPDAIARLAKNQGKAEADHGLEMSPLQHLDRGLPPTIIFQGTADSPAIIGPVKEFCQRAIALKDQCDVVWYPGAPHGFTEVWIPLDYESWSALGKHAGQNLNAENWAADTSRRTDAFLTRLGWLPGDLESK
jgi:acetyl esterase/lipase